MSSKIKGTLATIATSAIIIGVYMAATFRPSCMDICILDRFTIGLLCAALAAVVGAVIGIALSVLAALGACHRIHHFAFAGAAITLNIVALLCISTHSVYSIGSIDRLGDIAFGGVLGLAFAIGAGYKRLRQTSTPS